MQEYPYYIGFADETGHGAGEGFNLNLPLPWRTEFSIWRTALDQAIDRIAAFAPDRLVVSLGVDAFEEDPISRFKLKGPDFVEIGRAIGALEIPALFVMEGGYAIEAIGTNVANVLAGHSSARA